MKTENKYIELQAVALWLVRSSSDRAVRVRAFTVDNVLCS